MQGQKMENSNLRHNLGLDCVRITDISDISLSLLSSMNIAFRSIPHENAVVRSRQAIKFLL